MTDPSADQVEPDGAGRSADATPDTTTGTTTGHDEPAATAPAPPGRWARRRERRRQRVSKWDRPPDPHDWRFVVGTIGKVLIATGILMFGFVAYQLWGTGIETARAQNRLEDAFAAAVAENSSSTTTAPTTTTEPSPDDTTPDTTAPDTTAPDTTAPETTAPEPEPSDIVPGGVDLSGIAVDREVPSFERGDVIARLEIPRIDQDLYVVAGVTLDDLKSGPGWYPDSSLPGQLGNAAIAGHRTTYGGPFFDVDQLEPGDRITVTMITGDQFVYEVTGSQVVSATEYWVVTTRDPDVVELTLTSCHPKYTAEERIVVHSVLVPELSAVPGRPRPVEIDQTPTPTIPEDDPTVSSPETSVATTEESTDGSIPVTTGPDDTSPATTTTTPLTTTPPADPDSGSGSDGPGDVPSAPEPGEVDDPGQIDAFSQGWFDDDGAWPQIALWGLALTAISLLAYQVSKRTRHDSIGFLVGIGPFLFCLYFFFQNVNRLLPPGL